MTRILVIALGVVLWSVMLGRTAYNLGQRHQADADKAAQLVITEQAAENLRIKHLAAAAAGMRTEKAHLKTATTFAKIRHEYETEQQRDPAIGCVLDLVSLRLWNAANTESDSPASGASDDGLRQAADLAVGTKRRE